MSLVPEGWLGRIAAKRVAYGLAKAVATLLAYAKTQEMLAFLGIHVDAAKLQEGVAVATLGIMELAHDWARMKFPNVKWL